MGFCRIKKGGVNRQTKTLWRKLFLYIFLFMTGLFDENVIKPYQNILCIVSLHLKNNKNLNKSNKHALNQVFFILIN